MVHLFCVQTVDKTQVISDARGVRQKVADPGSGLASLPKRFHGSQHDLSRSVARHCAETLVADVVLRYRLPMHLNQLRLVVKEIDMSRPAVLKQIDHPFGFGREVWQFRQPARTSRRKTIASQQRGQSGRSETSR